MKALTNLLRRAHLRMRIRAAEFDAMVIQAEMQTAPYRLASTRAAITDMQIELDALASKPDATKPPVWRLGPWH